MGREQKEEFFVTTVPEPSRDSRLPETATQANILLKFKESKEPIQFKLSYVV